MISKVKSTYLLNSFVDQLQTAAKRYKAAGQIKDRRQWVFSEMVSREWEAIKNEPFVKDEITKYGHYIECSYWINQATGFPVVAASGETLRRWCEVWETYKDIPAFEEMRCVLSFDHFQKAKWLAHGLKVAVPSLALATALEHRYTADEMVNHFDPVRKNGVHPYEKVIGWLDNLQGLTYEWIKDTQDRTSAIQHLAAARAIIERHK